MINARVNKYALYTAKLSYVVAMLGLRLRQYVDDIQLYISVPVHDTTLAVQRFSACVADVNDWLRASRLLLNATKTQVMWLGSHQQISQVDVSHVPVLSELIKVVESARDLGVASTLTCHSQLMSPRSADTGSTTCDNYVR